MLDVNNSTDDIMQTRRWRILETYRRGVPPLSGGDSGDTPRSYNFSWKPEVRRRRGKKRGAIKVTVNDATAIR